MGKNSRPLWETARRFRMGGAIGQRGKHVLDNNGALQDGLPKSYGPFLVRMRQPVARLLDDLIAEPLSLALGFGKPAETERGQGSAGTFACAGDQRWGYHCWWRGKDSVRQLFDAGIAHCAAFLTGILTRGYRKRTPAEASLCLRVRRFPGADWGRGSDLSCAAVCARWVSARID